MVAGEAAGRVTAALPEIDGDRCVHARFATASCRACADACSRGALVLDEASLGIDMSRCDGCGVCRAACPEAAIEVPGAGREVLVDAGERLAAIACERSEVSPGKGVIACLHAVAERDLAQIAGRGVERIVIAHGACNTCERYPSAAPGVSLSSVVHRHNALAGAAARLLHVEMVSVLVFDRIRARAAPKRDDLDQGRRRLLGLGITRARGEPARERTASETIDARFRHVPEIEAGSCSGCDACARVCLHGAIRFVRDEARGAGYEISPGVCTGCGLCMDVCTTHAVTIAELSTCEIVFLPLEQFRCHRCGTPFHEPKARIVSKAAGGSETQAMQPVCGICRVTERTRRLFQVMGG